MSDEGELLLQACEVCLGRLRVVERDGALVAVCEECGPTES